jgi:hypothetical protein
LRKHLQTQHRKLFIELQKKEDERRSQVDEELNVIEAGASGSAKDVAFKTLTLPKKAVTKKWPLQDRRQLEVDHDIITLIATECLPFSFADSENFKRFMNKILPNATIKHSTTFSKNKLPQLYHTLKVVMHEVMEKELIDLNQVAITTDHWTSRANDSYMSVTLHYISPDFALKKFTLEVCLFKERHTGINIAKALDNTLSYPESLKKIPNKLCVIDQASNMACALNNSVSLITKEEGSVTCSDHKLNTALRRTVEGTPELKDAFIKASSLTTRLHKSTAFSASLKDACSRLDVNYLKIPSTVTTRWNSHYDMLHVMLRLKVPLIYLRDTEGDDWKKTVPTDEQFLLFEAIVPVLKSVKELSVFLSSDTEIRIDMSLWKVTALINFVEKEKNNYVTHGNNKLVEKFLGDLLSELNKRFPDKGRKLPAFALGHYLHPFFRGHLLDVDDENIQKLVENHPTTKEYFENSSLSVSSSSNNNGSNDSIADNAQGWEENEYNIILAKYNEDTNSHHIHENPPIKLEMEKYQKTIRSKNAGKTDTLAWWKQHAAELPILSGVARSWLATPPTSASSERAFSASGLVITDRRYNLDSDKADKLVFIMQNYSALENYIKKWPIEQENESDIEHESDLSLPILIEENPKIPTKVRQRKQQRMDDSQSIVDY